jgi:aldehyde dehydrogenase (NAD+)
VWLHGSSFEVQRKPYGVILIVTAGNYPLFLPGVQMLHALVAGNAVLLKPAEGASAPIARLLELAARAGIPANLIHLLPESTEAARQAARLGADKAIFTGSSENGRNFLAHLAHHNTPSVMELSGADTVYVRADADVALAARAIRFGTRLNNGNTCMAPHAIVVHREVAAKLRDALRLEEVAVGAVFPVANDSEALEIAAIDEHGLGAAVFSRDEDAARRFARQLVTGFVTINDIIVPTADPRLPFGGTRASGFGVTRGEEGLLEMTYPQAIAIRQTRFLPHLDEASPYDVRFFSAFASLLHGRGVAHRFRAFRELLQTGRKRMRSSPTSP